MSKRLWQVFWYELRRNARRKGYLFATFGLPVLAFVAATVLPSLFSGMDTGEDRNDPTNINLPTEIMRQIEHAGLIDETGRFSIPEDLTDVITIYGDETEAQAALTAGDIDVYYIIPEDYFTSGEVISVMPRLMINLINPQLIERVLLSELAEGVEPRIYERMVEPLNMREIDLARDTTVDSASAFDARMTIVYVFALILMGSLFMTNGYLLQSVIEEKETRLIEILLASVRPFELLGGKILALGLLGLLQVVVWFGALGFLGWLANRETLTALAPVLGTLASVAFPIEIIPMLLVYFILGYLLFAALFGVVGALSNSMREGPQYAVVFTLPALLPFYFLTLFATTPNAALPVILSLFPITAPLSMAQRLALTDVPVWQLLLSIALLVLSVVGVMWLAGRLFRVNTLLAGQVPRLCDLPRLLRG